MTCCPNFVILLLTLIALAAPRGGFRKNKSVTEAKTVKIVKDFLVCLGIELRRSLTLEKVIFIKGFSSLQNAEALILSRVLL